MCQETFLRAFRALPGFKGQAKFSSWLYRIALNLCRDWIRRQRRAPVVQMPEGVDPVELAAERGPVESIEELVARRELSAVVEEAMALLPEEQRTAIILKEYHGMTFQEIADLQGCPLSTVKTRLYQGLSVLRRHLEKNGVALSRSRVLPRAKCGPNHTAAGETIMSDTFTCGDHGALVSYLYDECAPAERRTIAAHLVMLRRVRRGAHGARGDTRAARDVDAAGCAARFPNASRRFKIERASVQRAGGSSRCPHGRRWLRHRHLRDWRPLGAPAGVMQAADGGLQTPRRR